MPGAAGGQAALPFVAAAIRYREKIGTLVWTPGTTAQDLSSVLPSGGIKSYGYLRRLCLEVSTKTAGGGGNTAADFPWNIISQVAVTQPNGEEMFGGPTFSGFHAKLAADHAGWRLNDSPDTLPSFVNSSTSPQMVLPINFEISTNGLGSLPNQDASAPWKLQLTGNTIANIWQTAPTTTPQLQLDVFMDCWTVPSPTNPLNPSVQQQIAPPLLGTLNKWTVQQYTIPSSSSFNVQLQRKGNAIRNLAMIARGAANARVALSNFPDPFSFRWDGTLVRANDRPLLVVDDEYATRGGIAAPTPRAPDTGVMSFQMSDVDGLDVEGSAPPYGFGMESFWGTVQSSVIEISGTWGANVTLLEVLTNDVQFVNLAGNPYLFAYGGYLQAPAQGSARP